MPHSRFVASIATACLVACVAPVTLHAQQDGLIAFPNVYKVQFENNWVRVVHVTLPPAANLALHSHPPGLMLHVYLNDAEPVLFSHDGFPNDVTRRPVTARSYRAGRATPESHAVQSSSLKSSDYLRVELKTRGNESMARRVSAPALANESATVVEVVNAQYRVSRITIASGQSTEIATDAAAASLLVALTDGAAIEASGAQSQAIAMGKERFVDVNQKVLVRNTGGAPVQLLRVDFLTKPE